MKKFLVFGMGRVMVVESEYERGACKVAAAYLRLTEDAMWKFEAIRLDSLHKLITPWEITLPV